MSEISYSNETLNNFIVFEGLDGSGSSTQSERLAKRLRREGRKVQLSCEPTPGPIGTLIRQIMRGRLHVSTDTAIRDRELAYLFAADRHDHLYNDVDGIIPTIDKGMLAISTRYLFSSAAYNSRTPEHLELILNLNRIFPLPRIIVFVTCPIEVSLERLGKRDVREVYEKEEELRRVWDNYRRILEPVRERVIEVDSTGDVDETADKIHAEVCERLK